jgi:hypothetical protein
MHQRLEKATGDGTITVAALEEILERQNRTQIAALAYSLWQARGCPDGTPDEDWFRAEREIAGSNTRGEVESRDSAERSIDADTASPSLLRFPVGSEISQAAQAGSSRRA